MKRFFFIIYFIFSFYLTSFSQSHFYNPTTEKEYDMITLDYSSNRELVDGYSFRNDLRQKIDGYEFHSRDLLRPKDKKRQYAGTLIEIHIPHTTQNYFLCIPTSNNHNLMEKFHKDIEKFDKPLLESLLSFLAYRYTQLTLKLK